MASVISASTTSATALNMSADTTGVLQFATGATPTTAVTIDTSQNVGIGVTPNVYAAATKAIQTPAGSLWNYSTTYQFLGLNYYYNTSGTRTYVNTGPASEYQQYNGNHIWSYAASGTGGTAVSFTEAMRIDSSGNVGIGTSSPTYKLDISSGSSNTLNITTANANTTIFNITRTSVTTVTHTLDSTGYKIINGGSGGLYLGYTGTSWTSLSDERFKTDLKPIENAIEKVSALRAVTGRFKTDNENKSRAFLIAQDIQAVLPEAVDTSNPEQLGVSYTDTIPLLVAAIKEQQTIINDLKARVTALEAK